MYGPGYWAQIEGITGYNPPIDTAVAGASLQDVNDGPALSGRHQGFAGQAPQ